MANRMNEPIPGDGPTSAKLLKLLECPVCFETMTESVYQCETGHSVCSRCLIKLDKCGVCHKKFAGTRNYAVEQIAESFNFKFYCKHKDEGCAIVTTRQELNTHQMTCPYRPVLCNDIRKTSCKNNPVKLGVFFLHLKNVHGCPGIDSESGSTMLSCKNVLNKVTGPGLTSYVKFNEKYFVYQTLFEKDTVNWWIYLIGTPDEAKNYHYELTILPTRESLRRNQIVKIKYELPVQTVHDDIEKIALAGGLASYPKKSLIPLSRIEGSSTVWKWNMELKIIEKKEDSAAQSKNPLKRISGI